MIEKMPLYEPKRNNLFVVNLPKELNIDSWRVQSINKPKIKNNKWNNITITFIDPICPSTLQNIFDYYKVNKKSFIQKLFKSTLFSFELIQCDPTGIEYEKWTIDVEDIISIDYGNLSYEHDNIIRITLILKIKNCTLNY